MAGTPTSVTWQREIRPFNRFYIRLTLLSGAAMLTLLTGVVVSFYTMAMTAEIEGLRSKIGFIAQAVALEVPPELAEMRPDQSKARLELTHRLRQLDQLDSEVTDIYVFAVTPKRDHFSEVVSTKAQAVSFLDLDYDVSEYPFFQRALSAPAVEDEVFDGSLSGYAPIRNAEGRTVAIAGVDVAAAGIIQLQRHVRIATWGAGSAAVLLLSLITLLTGRAIQRPLGAIIEASDAVAHGNLSVTVDMEPRNDEFGLLGRRFDSMVKGLREREAIRETFGRYVSEKVASVLLANPEGTNLGGEEREITVLFTDIEGYSTIAEHIPPAEVVSVLNEYFGAMSEIIDQHNGCIIEFLGDAILAVFNAPLPDEDHPQLAVACALEMRERIVSLNKDWEQTGQSQRWKAVGLDTLRTRMGIHTGRVVAGNLGSATRTKYAVIGDTVNLAARLEQLNKEFGTEILLSENTLRLAREADPKLRIDPQDRGELRVKGRETPVRVFSI